MALIEDVEIAGGEGAKKSYVVAGAILTCTFGTQKSRLKTPLSHGVFVKDKAQMNIKDFVPNVNIMPFGRCGNLANPEVAAATEANGGYLKRMPCMPIVTMPWIGGKENKLIEDAPVLLNDCTNMCLHCGGQISIIDDGQELD
ncbi:DUF4280 domain-containing protein [Brevibacterium sp. JNUCC-42]|uniref:DUF4280 domain-containing protein n=1 Tax=Brevibacillus laterosporus TaxID=1465 RepID=A0A502HA32_BRELA|nr:DUF4280 domain-containing protein [Brevibacillus laterosporus]QDX92974.1 DUF4280 domain-containing protein [Brevibacillus laterosporus]QOS97239.1 DUF4280 domain-containing protein [Brevibacterium sp. JNUCC-42]TPG71331.1 DUF4280 domain-containing protein [Brevibacillus laterosporus]TPG78182.1 DUF4280 domain-containing protein [Brevibacillus laterosporus]